MADLVILIGAPLIAWAVTARWSRSLPVRAPKRRANYRGIELPTACGIAVVGGMVAAFGLFAFAGVVADGALVDRAALTVPSFAAAAVGFGLLGLWDDLAGGDEAKGWRAHIRSLRTSSPSSGAIKLVGGVVFAFILTAGDNIAVSILAAGVLAGTSNLFNLLDLRPGRASKFWLVLSIPLAVVLAILGDTGAAVCTLASAAAVIAFLPHDLGERAMLGDVGANAMGAVAGAALIALGGTLALGIVLLVLIILHVFADRPGLSKLIDAVPPLRAFDRAGRAQG